MVNRFDNISTADLVAREMEERQMLVELQRAVRKRLIAESGIEIGAVYCVTSGRFAGRRMLVEGVQSGIPDALRKWPYETWAWGRLNGKSAAGDGWTIKRQNVGIDRLTKEN